MKFSSLKNLRQSVVNVLKRFYAEAILALIGTIAAITYIEFDNLSDTAIKTMMTAAVGLVINLSATLFCESHEIKKSQRLILKSIAVLITIIIFFTLNPLLSNKDLIRFFLLALTGHLLVAFAAFTKSVGIQGFWQFNKTLFLHFLTSILYSAVLFIGIAAAIGAMKLLFNIDLKRNTFYILWVCIAGLFNTLFFLAGVPDDFKKLNQDFSYPKGLKIFTQYVLIPLASLYVAILLAYEIKIIIQWKLPEGIVSTLILGYAVFGILSLLLIFPIREQAENKWIKTFARTFYFLMLPLLVLLFTAAGTRIFLYGITESRYFLMLLAFWLLFITVYFLLSKKQNIKVIPVSLSMLTLLSIYGPQSAFSVSLYSQKRILINIFERHHAFQEGKLVQISKISNQDGQKAVATLEYLIGHNDLDVLQSYVTKDLQAVTDSLGRVKDSYGLVRTYKNDILDQKVKWAASYFGLKNFSGYLYYADQPKLDDGKSYIFNTSQTEIIEVTGYDFIINQVSINYSDSSDQYVIGKTLVKTWTKKEGLLEISLDHDKTTFNSYKLINELVKDSLKLEPYLLKPDRDDSHQYTLPSKTLTFTKKTKNFIVTLKINTIRFSTDKNNKVKALNFATGTCLIKRI